MELIDKDTVVAEIKKRINYYQTKNQKWGVAGYAGRVDEGEEILDYINTLKVKDVDLEEEICSFFSKNPIPCEHLTEWPLLKNTAIHFFELGLKAQKGE